MTQEWLLLPLGVLAGIMNGIAGGGSLLTFPAFIAIGYSPFDANITNAVGVFPGSLGGVAGYRSTLAAHRREVWLLAGVAIVGSAAGTALLLTTGEATFESLAPWLMVFASLTLLFQPLLRRLVTQAQGPRHQLRAVAVAAVIAVYGGYFGVGMGLMFFAAYGVVVHESLQRVNAMKNAFAVAVNAVCVVSFAAFAHVHWLAAALMAVGTLVGGVLGAGLAQRLPEMVFRVIVVVIGLTAAAVAAVQ